MNVFYQPPKLNGQSVCSSATLGQLCYEATGGGRVLVICGNHTEAEIEFRNTLEKITSFFGVFRSRVYARSIEWLSTAGVIQFDSVAGDSGKILGLSAKIMFAPGVVVPDYLMSVAVSRTSRYVEAREREGK